MKNKTIEVGLRNIICYVFLIILLSTFIIYIPNLMDYYIIQPEHSLLYFHALNINDKVYMFESTVIIIITFIFWCITGKFGLGISIVSMLSLMLSYASFIKYTLRHELFRFDDLKLTEAAKLAFIYIFKCKYLR